MPETETIWINDIIDSEISKSLKQALDNLGIGGGVANIDIVLVPPPDDIILHDDDCGCEIRIGLSDGESLRKFVEQLLRLSPKPATAGST